MEQHDSFLGLEPEIKAWRRGSFLGPERGWSWGGMKAAAGDEALSLPRPSKLS